MIFFLVSIPQICRKFSDFFLERGSNPVIFGSPWKKIPPKFEPIYPWPYTTGVFKFRAHKRNIKVFKSIKVAKLTWQTLHKPQYCQSLSNRNINMPSKWHLAVHYYSQVIDKVNTIKDDTTQHVRKFNRNTQSWECVQFTIYRRSILTHWPRTTQPVYSNRPELSNSLGNHAPEGTVSCRQHKNVRIKKKV
jgi:hypothetical protein